jgi:hypothetical protein
VPSTPAGASGMGAVLAAERIMLRLSIRPDIAPLPASLMAVGPAVDGGLEPKVSRHFVDNGERYHSRAAVRHLCP